VNFERADGSPNSVLMVFLSLLIILLTKQIGEVALDLLGREKKKNRETVSSRGNEVGPRTHAR
jgi:hypothetical protein